MNVEHRLIKRCSDSVAARTLTTGMQTTGGQNALTVALCTSACAAGNYLYAGLEYASECCKFLLFYVLRTWHTYFS